MADQADLPEHTRAFIAKLGKDDIDDLDFIIRVVRAIRGWCRVNRWLALTVIGIIIVLAQGMDAILKLAGFKLGH